MICPPQALQNIAKTWDVIQLDIVPYKDKGHHRLRWTGLRDLGFGVGTRFDRWGRTMILIRFTPEGLKKYSRPWKITRWLCLP